MDNLPQPETVTVAVKLPKELDRAIEVYVAERGSTKQQFFIDALRAHLANTGKRNKPGK